MRPPTFKGFRVGTSSRITISGSAGTSAWRPPRAKWRAPSTRARASQHAPVLVRPLKNSFATRPKATRRTTGAASRATSDHMKATSVACIATGGGGDCARRSAAAPSSREHRSSRSNVRNAERSNIAVACLGALTLQVHAHGCSTAASCATSASFMGPSARFGRRSLQPSARKSRTSWRRQRARDSQVGEWTMSSILPKMPVSWARPAKVSWSNFGPTTVSRAARDSSASGVGSERSSAQMASMTFATNIFRTTSAPTKRMVPNILVLYLCSAMLRSSKSSMRLMSSGGVRCRSKEDWHSFNNKRLKLNFGSSLIGAERKCSSKSEQRSAYMSIKWCCVVAFSNTS
mmetsp:Transcript_115281/g.322223  ORF Transcript_115281/g.322223 Transcript_115281/m.322223 type:complete len:346 (-) Transcript_115281:887-1924(-)